MRSRSPMIPVLAAATLLGGCGPFGGGDDADDTNQAAITAFNSWFDAVDKGDGKKACALETAGFKKTALASSVETHLVKDGATCESVVTAGADVKQTHGLDLTGRTIKAGRKTPKNAVLTVKFKHTEPASYLMTLGSDGWKVAKIFDRPD